MKISNNLPTFTWCTRDQSRPLPTDFSLTALTNKWNTPKNQLSKRLFRNPIFEDLHLWMRFFQPDAKCSDADMDRGIPAELEPFFKEYYFYSLNSAFRTELRKGNQPPDFVQQFAYELHKQALDAEKRYSKTHTASTRETSEIPSAEDSVNYGLYWYRRLYDNDDFQKNITSEYWENEYEWRSRTIRELSQQLPQSEQISQLKSMLEYMDTQISYLYHRINTLAWQGSQSKKTRHNDNTFLQTFPYQLLNSTRNRVLETKKSKTIASYRIPDLPIQNEAFPKVHTLEDAFNEIHKKQTNSTELREHILPLYLKTVCTSPQKTAYQINCESLQDYLDTYFIDSHSEKNISLLIYRQCSAYYGSILRNQPLPVGYQQENVENNGLRRIISGYISSFYSDSLRNYGQTMQDLVNINSQLVSNIKLINIRSFADMLKIGNEELIYLQSFHQLKERLRSLWDEDCWGSKEILDDQIPQEFIDSFSKTMEYYCDQIAITYLGTNLPWATQTIFQEAWLCYNHAQTTLDISVPAALGHPALFFLSLGLLYCRVYIDVNHAFRSTLACCRDFIRFIESKQND